MAKKQRKRGHGEGCITQRKDGKWAAVITLGKDANGKQKRRFIYGNTRQEVSEKLTQALNDINKGLYINPNKSTLQDWLIFWINEYVENRVKLSTKVSYDLFINKHINPVIGYIPLSGLRGDIIQKFYNDKLRNGRLDHKGGLNPKTIKNMHNMLHEALEQALKNELIIKNPCKTVTLPKVIKKEMRVLSADEQQKLITIARTERLGVGIILTLFTGLRLGELLGLQWSDIDIKNGILLVRRTLNRLKTFDDNSDKKTSIVIGETKTLKSKRQIPLHEIMVEELKKFKILQRQEKLLAGELYENNDFIIANELGKCIEPRTYQDLFYKLIKKAEIAPANFHCLRHTFATRALERDVAAKTVSELLGHSNISTTLDLYSHVSHELKKSSIDKMADLFLSASKNRNDCTNRSLRNS